MKKQLSCLLLVSSAAACGLRLMQMRFGFEAETGLPVRGSVWGLGLAAALAVLALVWLLAVRPFPAKDTPTVAQAFPMTGRKAVLALLAAGLLLVAVSGMVWVVTALRPAPLVMAADGTLSPAALPGGITPSTMLFLGAVTLVMGLSLLPAVAASLAGREPSPGCSGTLLLVAPVCLVVRLVLVYRIHSVEPAVSRYAVELLAMVCLTMAFYRLSAFGCGVGGSRRFLRYAGWAVMLSLATLADGHGLADTLFYLGTALTLLGLILSRLGAAAPVGDPG